MSFRIADFIPEVLKEKRGFTEVYVLSLLMSLVGLISPLFFQAVIDRVVLHQATSTLVVLGVGVCAALVFEALFALAHDRILLHINPRIDLRTTSCVMRHLLALPIGFFHANPAGSLVRDVQQDRVVRDFITGRLFFSVTECTALVIFLPLLLTYNATLAGIVLTFSLAIALLSAGLSLPFRNKLGALYQADSARQALLVETLHGIETVKALGLEGHRQGLWESASAKALKRSQDFHWLASKGRIGAQTLEKAMAVAIIWGGALMVFAGHITVGQLVAFQMLSGRVTGPLLQLVSLIQGYQEARVAARQLGTVACAKPQECGARLRPKLNGRITVEQLRHSYGPDAKPVLQDLSFTIEPDRVLGIVGRSGSGKSTLMRLLLGLMDPVSGRIAIDGYDLRDLDRGYLRASIGVVPQHSFLFRGTVDDNISAGHDVSRADILWAAQQAGADEFIRALPQGYDTLLDEGAANLSGGQRQRIALARALVRNPAILILDEATSALDMESEVAIQHNLARITQGRTTIIITHRLQFLAHADGILVLEEGRMAGLDTHEALLCTCPAYAKLWSGHAGHVALLAAE